MVVSQLGQVPLPDVLLALVALVVVLFVARLVLRVAWKVAVLALVVLAGLWVTGMTDVLPQLPALL
ncbi:hypothetical protein [Halomarina oriensis]|uniref:Uncharacterized protein n=1 Tax=Halomarina oriensis TaxID=671145 RepID=A0A6B0GK52_9EURY|nr:hypothetical protein [Halomarina oriensis]MWG34197.1 hypothetical protein [Halomarina oriensis]